MRTERQRLAEELRSEGKEISREIKAVADKDKVVILADAYKQSQQLRGEEMLKCTNICRIIFKILNFMSLQEV